VQIKQLFKCCQVKFACSFAVFCLNIGVLPRPEGKWEDTPLPRPEWTHAKADNWTKKKALFGQNDYIGTSCC